MISRLFGWLRLSRRAESWKSAEILLLRHQLRVLQRQIDCRPKLTWADRALIALLLDIIPNSRRAGLRLFVSPQTVLRWRRDIVRRRWVAQVPAHTPWPPAYASHHPGCGPANGEGELWLGLPADPR